MSCASPAEVARYEARRSASDSDRGRPRSTGVDLGPTSSRLHASSSRRSQVVCDFTSDLQGREVLTVALQATVAPRRRAKWCEVVRRGAMSTAGAVWFLGWWGKEGDGGWGGGDWGALVL